MKEYDPSKIEPKWQKYWDKKHLFEAEDFSDKPKMFFLVEFPYPSGDGLHIGHCRSYTALDILARKRRMQGKNVLFPMGWDAFGLPAENYAIKVGIHPSKATKEAIQTFKRQEKSLGWSIDWQREINTTDPAYYKWTQWIFLKMFEKGLAYKAKMPINWCVDCKIGLANEEVVNGKCERCGGSVVKKEKKQWMLKITKYADRLLNDLEQVDYPDRVKASQRDWIGRSEGLEEEWQVEGIAMKLKTFTTWPHTSWGATFMVIAPEHPVINKLVEGTEYEKEAREFCKKVITDKIEDPLNVEKVKEGFFIGRYVINHLNQRRMPLYIANFAIYDYGTGIVKCTPAHDQRDFEFAKKYNLDLIPVIYPKGKEKLFAEIMTEAYTGEGMMMNAGQFNGMATQEARKAIAEYTIAHGSGRETVNYKIRDWVFSRQHYWGEPIPLVYCEKCGWVAVDEEDLPVELPDVKAYKPTDTGESPLASIEKWVDTKCPKCKGKAKRETDTMPNWAGSNWYFMRYTDPKNNNEFASEKKLKYWMPVDWYNGGMEHTTLHLLYSRFVYKFLWDIGAVPRELGCEPYKKRTSHGMILAEGGVKMSKSKGNVINPDDVIKEHGADTLRIYEMFMGPFQQAIAWDTQGVKGVRRFLDRVWLLRAKVSDTGASDNVKRLLNKTIKKVSEDIENLKFNTAVSQLMILVNEIENEMEKQCYEAKPHNIEREVFEMEKQCYEAKPHNIEREVFEDFLRILSPFAPHIAEELWKELGKKQSIFLEKWPKYDVQLTKEEKITLIVQVNGKVRGKIEADIDISEEEAMELAETNERVKQWLSNKEIRKVIFVKGKLINFVI